MSPKVKAAANKAYAKYLKQKKSGTLPKISPKVRAQAEKAYAKLKGKGVLEQREIQKRVLKKAKAESKAERTSLTQRFASLGSSAAAAAKAFQKFRRGEAPKAKLNPQSKERMSKAWAKYKKA